MFAKIKPSIAIISIGTVLLLFLLVQLTQIVEPSSPVKIYLFYFNACASCNDENEFLDYLYGVLRDEAQNKPYKLYAYNVFKSDAYYLELCAKKGIQPKKDWPVMIIGDQALYGITQIEDNILQTFIRY